DLFVAADEEADAFELLLLHLQPRIAHCQRGAGQRELVVARHHAQVAPVGDERLGLEVDDLARDLGSEGGRLEETDRPDAAATFAQAAPGFFRADGQRRGQADARDDCSPHGAPPAARGTMRIWRAVVITLPSTRTVPEKTAASAACSLSSTVSSIWS